MARRKLTTAAEELLKLENNKISEQIIKDVNAAIEGENIAFILGDQSTPADISGFISSGSVILDTIMTNNQWPEKNGGYPIGRLIDITGNESTGKSLLANHALIETQRVGGIPVLIDEEGTTSIGLLKLMGLKVGEEAVKAGLEKLVLIQTGTVEGVFETIEKIIIKSREISKSKPITIVWDSVAATSSKDEIEQGYEQEGYGTFKAKAISKGMRKLTPFISKLNVCLIFTNQLRQNISKFGHGDKFVAPGGKAIPFHASIRLRLEKIENIKAGSDKNDPTIGIIVKVTTRKNKVAPFNRTCLLNIYFNQGINDEESWLDDLVDKKIIEKPTKQKYSFKMPDRKPFEFKKSEWFKILKEDAVYDYVKKQVIQANVIDYSSFAPSYDEIVSQNEVEAAENAETEVED